MTKKSDKILTIILLTFLSLIFVIELGNLIKFGWGEFYLKHPDFPEGEIYKAELKRGKIKLTLWTIFTGGLLVASIVAKLIKKRKWINIIALLTFTIALYLPILAMINGNVLTGLIIGLILISFLILTIWNIKKDKSKAHNNV